jgi:uncharacterized protein (TIGR02996 family)
VIARARRATIAQVIVVEIHGPEGELRRLELDRAEATIGRQAGCDIPLLGGNVSKRHAQIVRRDDTITVIDLKSTNGTYVNGQKISSSSAIDERDTISIGDYRIMVFLSEVEPTVERLLPPFLARDPVEHGLLTEIAERNDAARVVYADWLEDRGELERAEFLRVQQDLVGSLDEARFNQLTRRLRALAASIDASWRTRVARPPVELCGVEFQRRCPKEWGKLEPTDRDGVRYCGSCKKTVHYTVTVADARRHARRGDCVALDIAEPRWEDDLEPPYGRFVCPGCDLDVGPTVLVCPRCREQVRQPRERMLMLGGLVSPPD